MSKWITASEIISNKDTHLYIYGDDKNEKAYRGQAETFAWYRGINCMPIYTRRWACFDPTNIDSQWRGVPLDMAQEYIERLCFDRIKKRIAAEPNRIIVICPKIGEGCSRLKWDNPILYKWIQDFLESIRK